MVHIPLQPEQHEQWEDVSMQKFQDIETAKQLMLIGWVAGYCAEAVLDIVPSEADTAFRRTIEVDHPGVICIRCDARTSSASSQKYKKTL